MINTLKKSINIGLGFSLLLSLSCTSTSFTPRMNFKRPFVKVFNQPLGWKTLPSMPEPRYNLQANTLGNKIYLSGGFNDQTILDTFERFDPQLNQWETLPPLPSPRYIHGSTVLNKELYLIGGYAFQSNPERLMQGQLPLRGALPTVDRYQPITGKWQSLAPLNEARYMPATTNFKGQIYVVGGAHKGVMSDTMEVFNPTTNQWTIHPTRLPNPWVWGQLVNDGRYLYLIGGSTREEKFMTGIQRFDPTTGQWQKNALPPMKTPRAGFSATLTKKGIYVFGGTNYEGFVGSNEYYSFKDKQWLSLPKLTPPRAGSSSVFFGKGFYLFGTDAWYTNNALYLGK